MYLQLRCKMARLAGESANSPEALFNTLNKWSAQLQHVDLEVEEPRP